MYVRMLAGAYAGQVRFVKPCVAKVMLNDGRAEPEYPERSAEPVVVDSHHVDAISEVQKVQASAVPASQPAATRRRGARR